MEVRVEVRDENGEQVFTLAADAQREDVILPGAATPGIEAVRRFLERV